MSLWIQRAYRMNRTGLLLGVAAAVVCSYFMYMWFKASFTEPDLLEQFAKDSKNTWYSRDFVELPNSIVEAADKIVVSGGLKTYNIYGQDVKVYSEEARPTGSGDPSCSVVLLHGAKYTSTDWKDLKTLNLIAAMGCIAVALDLPDWGQTEDANDSHFLPAVIEQHRLGRPVLISPSMSGLFALRYMMEPQPDTCDQRLSGFIAVAPGTTNKFTPRAYHRCRIPVAIVYGTQDQSALVSVGNLRNMPNSRIFPFSKTGHACYLDKADDWHKLLYNYLLQTDLIKPAK